MDLEQAFRQAFGIVCIRNNILFYFCCLLKRFTSEDCGGSEWVVFFFLHRSGEMVFPATLPLPGDLYVYLDTPYLRSEFIRCIFT